MLQPAMQARVKELAKPVPLQASQPYIALLPASPAQLLQSYPEVAGVLFSATRLPVSSPLNPIALAAVRARVICRGHAGVNQSEQMMEGPQIA